MHENIYKDFSAIQYEPSANLTLSVARKRFQKLTASMSKREKKEGDQDNESGAIVMKSKVQNVHAFENHTFL